MLDIMYLPTHVFIQCEHCLNLQLSIIDMGPSFRPPLQDIIAQDDASKHRPTRELHIDCVSRAWKVMMMMFIGTETLVTQLVREISRMQAC